MTTLHCVLLVAHHLIQSSPPGQRPPRPSPHEIPQFAVLGEPCKENERGVPISGQSARQLSVLLVKSPPAGPDPELPLWEAWEGPGLCAPNVLVGR